MNVSTKIGIALMCIGSAILGAGATKSYYESHPSVITVKELPLVPYSFSTWIHPDGVWHNITVCVNKKTSVAFLDGVTLVKTGKDSITAEGGHIRP